MIKLPPLSLYIHVPWCVRKCPYCDFNSHTSPQQIPERDYIDALIQDFIQEKPYIHGRELQSIFFGGGTPSLLSANAIKELLSRLKTHIQFTKTIEITLEANPGTFEQEKFAGFFQAGINRLSIGIQSFNPKHLTVLGRIHNADEALLAVEIAKRAGFENINLDLMHGLPNQTVEQALSDINTAIAAEPTHISWYQLTIEPNTVFYSKPPKLPIDDLLWDIQQAGQTLLAQHNYQQYEVSAYSKPGRPAQHNLNYWQFGDFIGIGAGAHGKLTDLTQQQIIRRWKTRLPKDYLNPDKTFIAGERLITTSELPLEFMMNAMRLTAGVPLSYFSERTGISVELIKTDLQIAVDKELLDISKGTIKPTPLGTQYLNDLLELFMS
ncbi:radical SAM family heme chaperone HemW [Spartinivicinus poritis]|uniref:Heme chaperone HemW n=1 Tax=Spartinivicinus poritis TaxID=2994640 RepID=A0ABT5UAA1_9GAMM|nr:radical SAM family heme chaperone HemW [Spartinivicinus sp. A2-2]MDE1463299.1 radical SAM family heme chaperone HemW [Spartinivicinus sp. A2-2]